MARPSIKLCASCATWGILILVFLAIYTGHHP
jgi:hypothetical protein